MQELLNKKTTKIGIAVIILAVAVGIISISTRSAQKQREYDGHVEAEDSLTRIDIGILWWLCGWKTGRRRSLLFILLYRMM